MISRVSTAYDLICPVCNKNVIRPVKTQEIWPTGKKTLSETAPEEAQMLNLLNKDVKSAIINKFKELKEAKPENKKKA